MGHEFLTLVPLAPASPQTALERHSRCITMAREYVEICSVAKLKLDSQPWRLYVTGEDSAIAL